MSDIRSKEELRDGGVTLLGNQNTKYETDYNPSVLETFENKHPDNDYVVSFDAYEFTSLCVSGDTDIIVVDEDGSNERSVPISKLVNTQGYVKSYDVKSDKIVVKKYLGVCMTQKCSNVRVISAAVNPNAFAGTNIPGTEFSEFLIFVTNEHPFLTKVQGMLDKKVFWDWTKAEDLKPGHIIATYNPNTNSILEASIVSNTLEASKDYVDSDFMNFYNMEVEDTQNFIGNNVILHNCPITSQPDFAKVIISYIPNKLMVESKSLKLYLFSFRNHGDFHEDCMNIIMKDLIKLMNPKYIEVKGIFAPRGGISIYPAVNWANPEFDYEDYAKQRQLDFLRDASNRTVKYDD